MLGLLFFIIFKNSTNKFYSLPLFVIRDYYWVQRNSYVRDLNWIIFLHAAWFSIFLWYFLWYHSTTSWSTGREWLDLTQPRRIPSVEKEWWDKDHTWYKWAELFTYSFLILLILEKVYVIFSSDLRSRLSSYLLWIIIYLYFSSNACPWPWLMFRCFTVSKRNNWNLWNGYKINIIILVT